MPTFNGTLVANPLTIGDDSVNKIGTHHSTLGVGGYMEVADTATRNAIPVETTLYEDGISSGRRRLGMTVRTLDDGKKWVLTVSNYNALTTSQKLAALANNSNWVEETSSVSWANMPAPRTNTVASATGSVSINLDNFEVFNLTLTGNISLTITGGISGKSYLVYLNQDGTGSRTLSFVTSVKTENDVAILLTTTASKTDVLEILVKPNGSYLVMPVYDV